MHKIEMAKFLSKISKQNKKAFRMTNVNYDRILIKCRELFPDKKSDRKCPECAKIGSDITWEPWMGSLKDHLTEHYRTKYYIEKV